MKKNMKKIIYLSYLVSLLFTCNKITDASDAVKKPVSASAIVPYVHYNIEYPIERASEALSQLGKQVKTNQPTRPLVYDTIKQIIKHYLSESTISIVRENKDLIGTCETKNWQKNKYVKQEIEAIQHKLTLLEKILCSFDMAFPIQEASLEVDDLIQQKKRGERINSLTNAKIAKIAKIENTLQNYFEEEKIAIYDEENRLIGISNTKGWRKNSAISKNIKTVKNKLAQLTEPHLNSDRK